MIKVKVRQEMTANINDQILKGGDIVDLPEDVFKNHEHIFEAVETKKVKDKDA